MTGLKNVKSAALAIALGLCVFAASGTTPVLAQDAVQRLCQEGDLVNHVFLLVDFSETPPGRISRWQHHFRYDYLHLMLNNYYDEIASNNAAQTQQQIIEMMKVKPGRYTLSKDGVLTFIKNDKIRGTYRCLTVLKPQGQYITGDVILTGYTRKKRSELYKHFRRWY